MLQATIVGFSLLNVLTVQTVEHAYYFHGFVRRKFDYLYYEGKYVLEIVTAKLLN